MDPFILVTGGAGFIGSHLVDALLDLGVNVRVADDFSTGRRENLDGVEARAAVSGARVQIIEADVRDAARMRDLCDGCAAVVHLAAVASVQRSLDDPTYAGSVTHGGTINVVRQAVDAEVDLLVLASSCAVYGDEAPLPVAETVPARPLSPYAVAKLAAERACAGAADAGQTVTVSLRFFNVYGARQDPSSPYSGVISRFMTAAAAGEPVTIYGDGRQTRDFIYVGDVVEAIVACLERPLSGASLVNIGTGRQTSLLEILDIIEELRGAPIERRYAPARPAEIRCSQADARRAQWVLGWEATTGLADGLTATWEWYA